MPLKARQEEKRQIAYSNKEKKKKEENVKRGASVFRWPPCYLGSSCFFTVPPPPFVFLLFLRRKNAHTHARNMMVQPRSVVRPTQDTTRFLEKYSKEPGISGHGTPTSSFFERCFSSFHHHNLLHSLPPTYIHTADYSKDTHTQSHTHTTDPPYMKHHQLHGAI